jgi:hypothetical protein
MRSYWVLRMAQGTKPRNTNPHSRPQSSSKVAWSPMRPLSLMAVRQREADPLSHP